MLPRYGGASGLLAARLLIGRLGVAETEECLEVRFRIHQLLGSVGFLSDGIDGLEEALGCVGGSAFIGVFPDEVGLPAEAGLVGGGCHEAREARCVGLLVVTYHFCLILILLRCLKQHRLPPS